MTWILGRDDWLSRRLAAGLARQPGRAGACEARLLPCRELDETAGGPDLALARGGLEGADLVLAPSLLVDRWGFPAPAPAERLLARCAELRPAAVVVLSSFAAHEPSHHHPGLVAESFPAANRFGNPIALGWRALETTAMEVFSGCCPLTVLRLASTPAPDGRCILARRLRAKVAAVVPGYDPQIQLLDPDDLAAAVALAIARRSQELLQVAPAGTIPLRAALRLAGCRPVAVPLFLQRIAVTLPLWVRSRGTADLRAARAELDYLRFPATQSGQALRRLGCAPRHSSAETVLRWCPHEADDAPREVGAASPRFDDWGMSRRFVEKGSRSIFWFLRRVWFRSELEGLDHVPGSGPAVLVGTHRGFVPLDAMLLLDALARERGRWPRFLVHPGLLRWPHVSTIITRLGGVVACRENAERVLERGGVLGVFPEGLRGPFRLLRDSHRVGRFLSDDFVEWAHRHRAPLVPFVTIGAAESFPILGRIESRWWRRRTEWPFVPLTPTTPFLPVPLPVKWRTHLLEPIVVDDDRARSARSRREVSAELRASLQRTLTELLAERRSVIFG